MHIGACKILHQLILSDFDTEEFIFMKKIKRKIKLSKVALGMSYAMLTSALLWGSSEAGFTATVASLILIFYFQNKIKNYVELVKEKEESIDAVMRKYIASESIDKFRSVQLSKLENGQMSRIEYQEFLKEDVCLLFSLMKNDCVENNDIDVVSYKFSVENLFKHASMAVESGHLENEELLQLKRKWASDLQVLCNQYAKTDIEVELKYLCVKINEY